MQQDLTGVDYARSELDALIADMKRVRKELDLFDEMPRWKSVRICGAIKASRYWQKELHRRMAECEQPEIDQ